VKAWLFQDHRQKEKLGDKCPWSVGWFEDGRKRSKKIGCQSMAEKYAQKLENQAEAGTLQTNGRTRWAKFRQQWEAKIGAGMEPQSQRCTLDAIGHFERIIKPGQVQKIRAQTIDEYISKRRLEKGKKADSRVSPATVNKELRHLRAVLRVAFEWGYLPKMPRIRMVKEPEKLIRYVTPEHFAAIYAACDSAERPKSDVYSAADWWRALLVYLYMTGWPVNKPLAASRADPVRRVRADPAGRLDRERREDHRPALPRAARAHRRLPLLRLPRPTAGVCHAERLTAYGECLASPDEAQELLDH
jgi:hypothetical protein